MRRVAVVVTARPSYSRIRTALEALRGQCEISRGQCEISVVASASAVVTRFGRIADQIKADGFDVTEVSSVVEEDSLANSALSTGVLLTQLSGVLERLKPDVVVTIADRHETLATAIAASYQHIPLCHVQGGEVTGSIDDKVRNAITQLADVHCVSTEMAALRVSRMSPGAAVHVTGCPSIDLAAQVGDVERTRRVLVLQHPVTDEPDAGAQMQMIIDAVRGLDVVWFWPGEDSGGQAMCKALRLAGKKPRRNVPPLEFLTLLKGSACIVGNSSVAIREASFLGVPAVNIGTRQRGRERAQNVIDVPYSVKAIEKALFRQLARDHGYPTSHLYGDGKAGERIASVLLKTEARKAA